MRHRVFQRGKLSCISHVDIPSSPVSAIIITVRL
jgi:hypothetical protein